MSSLAFPSRAGSALLHCDPVRTVAASTTARRARLNVVAPTARAPAAGHAPTTDPAAAVTGAADPGVLGPARRAHDRHGRSLLRVATVSISQRGRSRFPGSSLNVLRKLRSKWPPP